MILDREALAAIRAEFPCLAPERGARAPVYLDSACVSLRPRAVLQAIAEYYEQYPGCHGRSEHLFGRLTSERFESAREVVRAFLGARDGSEIVFLRNATEAINLVARSFPFPGSGSVVTTEAEHNSNLVPWLQLVAEGKVAHRFVPCRPDTTLDLDRLEEAARGASLVSVFMTSNISGVTLPVEEIVSIAHRHGAALLIDAAQALVSKRVDVAALGVDFLVFSGHKVHGPSGTGVLYARKDRMETLRPFLVGGETVADVRYPAIEYLPGSARFEAGIQDYAGAMGLAAAIRFVESIGEEAVASHVRQLNRAASERLLAHPRVHVVGPRAAEERGSILNFWIDGLSSREIAEILDRQERILVRHGQNCAHHWYNSRGIPHTVRASFGIHNTVEEVERFAAAVGDLLSLIG